MKTAVSDDASIPASAPVPVISAGYTLYAVLLLTAINVVASIDRRVINVLAEPIKNELHLTDWQVGMMAGLAFAIFYAALGFPIARIADRHSRSRVIVTCLTVWSAFTVLSSMAANFFQLFLYRMGVGVGEAGCGPPAQAFIADHTPREKRGSALALWSTGVPLGTLFGFALGGVVADHYGWRAAFLVAGLPGILLALLAAFTLKETRARMRAETAEQSHPSIRELLRVLVKKRTYWVLMLCVAVKMINTYGLQAFVVSFFLRNHTAQVAQLAAEYGLKSIGFLGITIGLISGACGAISIYLGGWIADRTAAKDLRDTMIAPAIGGLIAMPLSIVALLIDDTILALALFSIPYLLNGFGYGPVYAIAQGIVPKNMRASSSALSLFMQILIGQAAGPVLIGLMSDYLSTSMGAAEGLRWSLIGSACLAIPCAMLYLSARKTMREDMES